MVGIRSSVRVKSAIFDGKLSDRIAENRELFDHTKLFNV